MKVLRYAPILLVLLAGPAWAHPGHGEVSSFTAGLMHPWTGADHLLAMLAVGLWASLAGGTARWAVPVAFVTAMLTGFGLAVAGVHLPLVEPTILASVIALGALVALTVRLPWAAGATLVALFGLCHGHAHGAESPESGLALYALGFTLSTAAIHVLGLALGRILTGGTGAKLTRVIGAATAAAGVALGLAG
ncbi:MAG: HupE/UreJ family protein [Alphaproteobacteria bacterium]